MNRIAIVIGCLFLYACKLSVTITQTQGHAEDVIDDNDKDTNEIHAEIPIKVSNGLWIC